MTEWTSPSRLTSGTNVRRFLAAGIAGLLIVLALPSLWDVWQVDQAGVLVNRAIVAGADAAARADARAAAAAVLPAANSQTETSSASAASRATISAGGDFVLTPQMEAWLKDSLTLMESAASRGPHTAAREGPIWRTYGAAARMLPSDHAFEMLLRSRNAGRLDWLGELWLGEVASSTAHWDEAAQAYRRVDVSNLLIYRAEAHIRTGQSDLALRELALAKVSLDALADREKAERLLLDRTGNQPPALEGVMQPPAERATSLSRIGDGLLTLGQPLQAIPLLEQALDLAAVSPPGITVQRKLRFDLAAALAQTLPEQPTGSTATPGYYYYPDKGQMARLSKVIRVEALVSQALALEHTAATCSAAGRILLQTGDDVRGVALLTESTQLDPLIPDTYISLGKWYDGKGMALLALQTYAEAAARMPEQPALAAALAISTYRTVSHQQALPLLEKAAALSSTDPDIFAYLGDCYRQEGRTADARAVWQEGLRRSPGAQPLEIRLAVGAPTEAMPATGAGSGGGS
jgi:tetratricopeptide (TPR) repeat protein